MLIVVTAGIVGGIATACAFLSVGAIATVVAAPIGGSACALFAAVTLSVLRGSEWQDSSAFEEQFEGQTDAMVAALRGVAAQGHGTDEDCDRDRRGEHAA